MTDTHATLDEMAVAALHEQKAELTGSLGRILGAMDIDGDEDGWEDDAVQRIGGLRDLEDLAYKLIDAAKHGAVTLTDESPTILRLRQLVQ
jgi:hypothetical protein